MINTSAGKETANTWKTIYQKRSFKDLFGKNVIKSKTFLQDLLQELVKKEFSAAKATNIVKNAKNAHFWSKRYEIQHSLSMKEHEFC